MRCPGPSRSGKYKKRHWSPAQLIARSRRHVYGGFRDLGAAQRRALALRCEHALFPKPSLESPPTVVGPPPYTSDEGDGIDAVVEIACMTRSELKALEKRERTIVKDAQAALAAYKVKQAAEQKARSRVFYAFPSSIFQDVPADAEVHLEDNGDRTPSDALIPGMRSLRLFDEHAKRLMDQKYLTPKPDAVREAMVAAVKEAVALGPMWELHIFALHLDADRSATHACERSRTFQRLAL